MPVLRRLIASLAAAPIALTGVTMATQPTPAAAATAATQSTNRIAYKYFVAKGLTPAQAAGVVGNLMQESGSPINPRARQSGGSGRGIAQWSVGGRWDRTAHMNVAWYAKATHRSPWALNTQLDFIWYELTHVKSNGLAQLRTAKTVSSASLIFAQKYERCGICANTQRTRYANTLMR